MNLAGVGDALKKSHGTLRDGGDALVLMPASVPSRVHRDGVVVGEFDNAPFAARLEIAHRGIAAALDAALYTLRFERSFEVLEYFSNGQDVIDQESDKGAHFGPELQLELARPGEVVVLKPSQLVALRKQ
jgi:hypothetical protein